MGVVSALYRIQDRSCNPRPSWVREHYLSKLEAWREHFCDCDCDPSNLERIPRFRLSAEADVYQLSQE